MSNDRRAANARYRASHRDQVNTWKRQSHLRQRIVALHVYSHGTMACSLCRTDVFEHLTIDHLGGGGTRHRQSEGRANCGIGSLLHSQGFPDGYRVLCQNCNFLAWFDSREISGNYMAKAMTKHRLKRKVEALSAYSDGDPHCAECGVVDIRVLTLDHVSGGGREELKRLSLKGGVAFYRELSRMKYPSGFQVLCFNHNSGKRVPVPSPEFLRETIARWTASVGQSGSVVPMIGGA